MADRVPSDHPSVETVRATLVTVGGTDRLAVAVPADAALPADEVVRLVLDGDEYHAQVQRELGGDDYRIQGAFDAPRFARTQGAGQNRLPAWVDDADVAVGGSVLLDVVVEDFLYGLRAPGDRAVYAAREPPAEGLAAIAEQVQAQADEADADDDAT